MDSSLSKLVQVKRLWSCGYARFSGGIVGDHNSVVIFSFAMNLETSSVVMVELWVVRIGLKIAECRSFWNLVVEFYSLVAINLIKEGCFSTHECYQLVNLIDVQEKLLKLESESM
ncbi:hypothetical protein VNO78_20982 [Psophocarpus tetragonolobus]|uniref:RNase H type-1 domain-containing protein n=1 Tax=Psophocarpus tetragonolobus TaxID=3891 RepID=A0AAN9SAC9_PSOTE